MTPKITDGGGSGRLVLMLGSVTAIGPLSIDMYLPAFPAIAGDLGVRAAQVQSSLIACVLGIAVGQLTYGPLSDRWGRRRLLVTALLAYASMSFLIALAPSAPALTGLRLAQGMAGGAGVVIARAIVRDLFAGAEAARFLSRLTMIFGLAPVLAPLLGGGLLRLTSWRGIFVALGIIGLLIAAMLAAALPETLPPERRSPGGLGETGRTARALLRDKIFLGYALTQALSMAALFTYLGGSPFVLQDGYGVSPTGYALLFALNSVSLILFARANGRLLTTRKPRPLLLSALLLQIVSGAVVVAAALLGSLPVLIAGLFLLVGTIGMVPANATALALDRHPERAGTAAALIGGLQSVIAAAATPLATLGDAPGGLPMGAVILGFALAALLTVTLMTGRRV